MSGDSASSADASESNYGSQHWSKTPNPFLQSASVVSEENYGTGPEVPDHGTKSLRSTAEIGCLRNLQRMLYGEWPAATSVCNGEVKVSQPVTVRWEFESAMGVLKFPSSDDDPFKLLYENCQLVTPKENRHSNVELHKTDFTTDFHPYDYGIIDTIEQFLLPSILNAPMYSNLARSNYFGVKAELEAMDIRSSFVNNESRLKEEDSTLKKDQFGYLYVHLGM